MTITRFAFPTPIHFGAGARRLVAGHLNEAGLRRPLIVTDRALAALPGRCWCHLAMKLGMMPKRWPISFAPVLKRMARSAASSASLKAMAAS